jgi:hypothetical protein
MLCLIRMKRQLTFKRKFLSQKDGISSGDRPYIDFLIDGTPLSEVLGGVNSNIGKFGWGNSKEAPLRNNYELNEINDLIDFNKPRHNNGLYSVYVCAECGDEGCLAVMFKMKTKDDLVIWSDFVWSNGEDDIDDSHVKYELQPIVFGKEDYIKSLKVLKEIIKN